MKKWAIRILTSALTIFSDIVVSKINSEWVKKSVELTIKRLALFGEALTDANPHDKVQIEKIARETWVSSEFQDLEKQVMIELTSKIGNPQLVTMITQTDKLRSELFAVLGDDVVQNGEQAKRVFEDFIKTEEFDSLVISLVELLTVKYSKNEIANGFIISVVTSLVNSDDND